MGDDGFSLFAALMLARARMGSWVTQKPGATVETAEPAHPRQKVFLPPFEFCTARTELESAFNGKLSPRLGGLRPWAAKYCKISQV